MEGGGDAREPPLNSQTFGRFEMNRNIPRRDFLKYGALLVIVDDRKGDLLRLTPSAAR